MSNITLYSSLLSANGRKVEAVCLHLAIDVEIERVNVYQGQGQSEHYLAVNPLGKIPTLKSADLTLSESNAIIVYLAEKFADGTFAGGSSEQRAAILQWLFWESAHWQPVLSTVMEQHVGHRLLPDIIPAPDRQANWDNEEAQRQLHYLETQLADSRYLVGGQLSLADFSVAAMMTYVNATGFPFEHYPNIVRWYTTICELEAWKATEHESWQLIR